MNLRECIVMTGMYYEKALTEPLIEMYAGDLADLPEAAVVEAYQDYRRNPKNRTFPLPAQIREILAPVVSDEAWARELVARIPQAVSRFGYSNGADARAFIGEHGWQVVKAQGGWSYLCENLGAGFDVMTFQAQAREFLKSRASITRAETSEALALSAPETHITLEAPQDKSKGGAVLFEKPGFLGLVSNLKNGIPEKGPA